MLGIMPRIITRRARETHKPYRLPDRHELVPGLEVLMVDITKPWNANSHVWGTIIQLDDNPIRVHNGKDYVHYHCVSPAWNGDCFVPLLKFTGEYIWPHEDAFVQIRFWIAIR